MGPHGDFYMWLHMWGVSHVELTCGTHMWNSHVDSHVDPHMWKTGGSSTCGCTCEAPHVGPHVDETSHVENRWKFHMWIHMWRLCPVAGHRTELKQVEGASSVDVSAA